MRNNPYNEYFLEENYCCDGINVELPLRLQKRQLLKNFGFDVDRNLKSSNVNDSDNIKGLFNDYYRSGEVFHVLVSERKMNTSLPPLFTVYQNGNVKWRDDHGRLKTITKQRMNSIIREYKEDTWLEFATNIWNKDMFAGRLLYHNAFEQDIEIQKGVKPSEMVNSRKVHTYFSKITGFSLIEHQYHSNSKTIERLGYQKVVQLEILNDIFSILKKHKWSFRQLYSIANKPTLEFAYDEKKKRLMAIDIDWPKQWKNQGGNHEGGKNCSFSKA